MADQGRWFKLWVTAPYDPDLGSLSLEDFARWCLFGIYLKTHGTNGAVSLVEPALPVQQMFRVTSFSCVLDVLKRFPNCALHPVTNSTVSYRVEWSNWAKYQGDFSTDRVKRHREKIRKVKRSKKRGEEKRREKKRKEETPPSSPPAGGTYPASFEAFWADYPKKVGKGAALRSWLRIRPTQDLADRILGALAAQKQSEPWLKDNGQFIPHPLTWLNQRRWEDEGVAQSPLAKPERDPKQVWKTQENYLAALKAGAVVPKQRVPEWEPQAKPKP